MTEKLYYFMIDDRENDTEIYGLNTLEEANSKAEYHWTHTTNKEKNEPFKRIWVAYLTEEDKKMVDEEIEDEDDTSLYDYYDYIQNDNTTFDSDIYRVYEELSKGRYFDISKLGQGKDENFYNIELTLKNWDRYEVKDIPYLNYDNGKVLTREEARQYYGKYFGNEFIDDDEFLEDGDYVNEILEYIVYNNLLFPGYTYMD